MKPILRLSLALAAVVAMLALGTPVSAHGTHTSMNLNCANPSPNTAGAHGTASCSFDLPSDFGSTSNDKTDWLRLYLPVDAKLNEKGTHDGADPNDGEKIGQTTVATDLNYDGCGDNNDGGTYRTNWETTYTSYTAPTGWTKVAEYDTVFTVLFFFTEHVPSHVIKNNTTGQYAVDTNMPEGRVCLGVTSTFNPLVTYGYAQDNSTRPWVGKNPSTAGTYTVTMTATEVGGDTHTDTDTITIS